MFIMAFSISGVLGVVLPAREVAEDEVGTASEQLREIVLFLPDIVDLFSRVHLAVAVPPPLDSVRPP